MRLRGSWESLRSGEASEPVGMALELAVRFLKSAGRLGGRRKKPRAFPHGAAAQKGKKKSRKKGGKLITGGGRKLLRNCQILWKRS